MAATPKTGVVTFKGLQSGNVYNVPLYNAEKVSGVKDHTFA
jgi:hypothetical protein